MLSAFDQHARPRSPKTPRKQPGGSQEVPRGTQKAPRDTQEAARGQEGSLMQNVLRPMFYSKEDVQDHFRVDGSDAGGEEGRRG